MLLVSPREWPVVIMINSDNEKAIVQMQDDSHDQRMLKTVFGALFFGVPNHGMDITALGTMVRGQPNEQLVTQLGPDSDVLDRLATDFERVFNFSDSRILCFCETALSPTAVEDPLVSFSIM